VALSLVGTTLTTGATGSFPAGIADGDLVLAYATNGAAATVPNLATNYNDVGSRSGNSTAMRTAWKFYASGDPSPQFTNADAVMIEVFRGADTNDPIGAYTNNNASSSTITFLALTPFDKTDGTSWFSAAVVGNRPDVVIPAPTGTTLRQQSGTRPGWLLVDTNGGVTTWAQKTVTVSRAAGYTLCEVEVKAKTTVTVGITRRTPYKMNGMVQVQRDLPYKIRLFVQAQRDLVYQIDTTVGVVRRLPSRILVLAGIQRATPYIVRGLAGTSRTVLYVVRNLVGVSRRSPYVVKGLSAVVRTLRYGVAMKTMTETFTDANTTLLQNHVSDDGYGYTRHPSFSFNAQISDSGRRLRPSNNNASAGYTQNYDPPTADYTVAADLVMLSSVSATVGVYARLSTSVHTGYAFYYANGSLVLNRFNGGVSTVQATSTFNIAAGTTRRLELQVIGSRIIGTVYAGTTIVAGGPGSAYDVIDPSPILSIGRPGLRTLNTTTAEDQGLHLDNFSVTVPAPQTVTVGITRALPYVVLSSSPVSVVGVSHAFQSGVNGNVVPNHPTGTSVGDYVLVWVATRTSAAPPVSALPAPSGASWKLLASAARGSSGRVWLFGQFYEADFPTFTISGGSGNGPTIVSMISIRGLDPKVPIGEIIIGGPSTATAQTSPAIDARTPNLLVLRFIASALAGSQPSYSWNAGTEREDFSTQGIDAAWGSVSIDTENAAAPGTVPSRTATYSGSAAYITMTVAANPVGSSVTVQSLSRIPYLIRQLVSVQRRIPYVVRALISAQRRIVYTVRNLVATSRALPYGIRKFVGAVRRAPYAVRGFVGLIRRLPWTTRGFTAVSRVLSWVIKQSIINELLVKARIKVDASAAQVDILVDLDRPEVKVDTALAKVQIQQVEPKAVVVDSAEHPQVRVERSEHPVVSVSRVAAVVRVGSPNPKVHVKENN